MADTNFRGPINAMGALEGDAGTTATVLPLDGPSNSYQGWGLLDPRAFPFAKDGFRPGQAPAFFIQNDIYALDAIPQAAASNTLAVASQITAATGMNLATVGVTNFSSGAASLAVGVPIIPQGTTVVTTASIALDFGFTSGTSIANSTALTVADNTLFTVNQWLVVGNVGNSTATRSLTTQVQQIHSSNTTTIYVSPAPATAMGVPIGQASLYGSDLVALGTQFGPQTATANSHNFGGRIQGGLGRYMNPREMLARGISVQASTVADGTATILVSGWDVWGQAMTELLTASGTTPVYGKKAFKYVQSAVPQAVGTTVSATYTIGISDVFGFPFRADQPEHVTVQAGGTSVANVVGITTAVITVATNTSGDVRGSVQVSGLGGGTPISAVSTSNNVKRLFVIQSPGVWNELFTTPNNLRPMFGTTQV
jgi:hypothetical protein